ncbi:MAG: DUF928 domain-containing protein [Cyanosarcina radialis HA8281-LM2]|jgi:hypothetical protein|nr:DUF928 domain-containing protein [Cyanosarcina radialis HA8281-LM2]
MKPTICVNYLSLILAFTAAIPLAISPIDSVISAPTIQAATNSYDRYMKLGYRATAKRDYRNALVNFRKALQARPGDRYATTAISNVSSYAARRERKLVFIPGIKGAPVNRLGAGSRNPRSCLGDTTCLFALIPDNDRVLLTTAAYPKLLFYVPQTSGKQIELLFRSTANNAKTYQLSIPAPARSGIVSFDLSTLKDAEGKSLPPLEIGNKYKWNLAIILNSDNNSENLVVDGVIERQQVNPELAELLQQGSPSDRISLYTVNNFWYDAVATLYQERQAQPNNSSLVDDWTSLLESIDLGVIAKEPLVECCLAKN